MDGQYTYSRNYKPIMGVAIVGFVLVALSCKLDGAAAQVCNLLDKTTWVGLEVLRVVILLANWQTVSSYFCEGSTFLQHLLQIAASIWPPLAL